jgi:3-isopropylmalate dehydrogenase
MMLEILGEEKGARSIERAIVKTLTSGKIKDLSAGKMGISTSKVGDLVASFI